MVHKVVIVAFRLYFIEIIVDIGIALYFSEILVEVEPLIIVVLVIPQRLNFETVGEVEAGLSANLNRFRSTVSLEDTDRHKFSLAEVLISDYVE